MAYANVLAHSRIVANSSIPAFMKSRDSPFSGTGRGAESPGDSGAGWLTLGVGRLKTIRLPLNLREPLVIFISDCRSTYARPSFWITSACPACPSRTNTLPGWLDWGQAIADKSVVTVVAQKIFQILFCISIVPRRTVS